MSTAAIPSRKLELLYYTRYFTLTLKEAIGFAPKLAEDLCTVTLDRRRLAEVDAVIFHIPNLRRLPLPKRPGQIWVAMSMESDANYPIQSDLSFMRQFDICMSFRRSSDIPMLYFHPEQIELLRTPPKPKFRPAPAVYFASNDFALNNRYELIRELMRYIEIDSYGKSQNNRKLEQDTGRMTKLDVISGYKFYLAFENSNAVDYVSEKMFDGLIAGTVPVYLGAPNIDDYLPGRNCLIKVQDFSGPRELAQHLIWLSTDQAAYEEYLAWKREPVRQSFLDLVSPGNTPTLRRLCYKIAERIATYEHKQSSCTNV
jgi:hypothetical protein